MKIKKLIASGMLVMSFIAGSLLRADNETSFFQEPLLREELNLKGDEELSEEEIQKLSSLFDSLKGGSKDKEEPEHFSKIDMVYKLDDDHPTLAECFNGKIPPLVQNIIAVLKGNKKLATKKYGKLEKNLILHGPPGTGKTTVAQLIAKETGRKLFGKNAGTFQTVYQASEVASIKNMFATAKKYGKPCIIFFDEVDGIMSQLSHTSKQDNNKTLKALIGYLDEIKGNPNIYVIATTNYLSKLDKANADRFFVVEMAAPGRDERKTIIKKYLKECEIFIKGETDQTAQDTPDRVISPRFLNFMVAATSGLTGRTIKTFIKDAALRLDNGIEVVINKPGLTGELKNMYRLLTLDLDSRRYGRDFLTNYWSCSKNTLIEKHLYACILDERMNLSKMENKEYYDKIIRGFNGHKALMFMALSGFAAVKFLPKLLPPPVRAKVKDEMRNKLPGWMTWVLFDAYAEPKENNGAAGNSQVLQTLVQMLAKNGVASTGNEIQVQN